MCNNSINPMNSTNPINPTNSMNPMNSGGALSLLTSKTLNLIIK